MLKILQKDRIADGLVVLGFGMLAIGIAMNFQVKKTEKTEIKIESNVKGINQKNEPTETKIELKNEIKKGPSYAPSELRKGELKININKAGVAELDTLNGVGPAIAQRIIDYRKENKGFMNIEEIKLVKGIGDKMYEKIKDNIEI